ncbi:MAG: ATPase domain-containing protein [Rhodospirillaceae bacterium]
MPDTSPASKSAGAHAAASPATVSTGVAGIDHLLQGGLPRNRFYLVEGKPGSGKTTLGLQFLIEGVRRCEKVLYITLSETSDELHAVAASHGLDLSGVDLFELGSAAEALGEAQDQTVLHPWEVELGNVIQLIRDQVEKVNPQRVVFDSLSELRLLAQESLRYRRQVLAFKQFFAGRKVTVIIVDDMTDSGNVRDAHLHSICHGVITLERTTLEFGPARRRLEVQKLRGVDFIAGYHDFVIRKGGLVVFPRLVAAAHHKAFIGDAVTSSVPQLDSLMGGGPLRGSTVLITGPAGTGKTTIALQYMVAACARGEPATIIEFDERIGTLMARSRAMGFDLQTYIDNGLLSLLQVDPAEMSPGEFAARIREDVRDRGCKLVVVDSLDGYIAAMPQEHHLFLQMHELLSYLNQNGVLTFLINIQTGLLGNMSSVAVNISYIADTVMMIRFFEAGGRMRKAISVIKNRAGPHEDAIRELRIDAHGVRVGEPLMEFRGVMTGTPEYIGNNRLMEDRDADGQLRA